MKIAIIGQGKNTKHEIEEKAKELGREVARNKCVLVTGGCLGYPFAAVKGALAEKGKTIAISPAKDKKEHVDVYGFPLEQSEIAYTGLGIPGRNKEVVLNGDVVIAVGGSFGTLNELTTVMYEKKPLGVLIGSGGVADVAEQIVNACESYALKDKVVYSDNPKELVKRLLK
jgi:uncharacterized protein (TIGR00725 family)